MAIHIKKANRGKLHKALGVKAGDKVPLTAEEKAAHSGSEKLRKEAQFAINARKWKHGTKKSSSRADGRAQRLYGAH